MITRQIATKTSNVQFENKCHINHVECWCQGAIDIPGGF